MQLQTEPSPHMHTLENKGGKASAASEGRQLWRLSGTTETSHPLALKGQLCVLNASLWPVSLTSQQRPCRRRQGDQTPSHPPRSGCRNSPSIKQPLCCARANPVVSLGLFRPQLFFLVIPSPPPALSSSAFSSLHSRVTENPGKAETRVKAFSSVRGRVLFLGPTAEQNPLPWREQLLPCLAGSFAEFCSNEQRRLDPPV